MGTNISPTQGIFEDEFSFSRLVRYLSSPEDIFQLHGASFILFGTPVRQLSHATLPLGLNLMIYPINQQAKITTMEKKYTPEN